MRRWLYTGALIAAASVGLGYAAAQQHAHTAHPAIQDARTVVTFPAPLADHTLANMRDHLMALQEISSALAEGNARQAADVAENRLGMSSLPLHGAQEVAKYMPQGMQDAGTAMHRAASRFAIEARNAEVTGDLKTAIGALGEIMGACVGCHSSYRLK
jgi:hypothetical protein